MYLLNCLYSLDWKENFHGVKTLGHRHADLSNKRNLFRNTFPKEEGPCDAKATTLHLEIEFALEAWSSIVSLPFSAFLRPSPGPLKKIFLEMPFLSRNTISIEAR